jgi:hypothetical protein
LPKETNHDLELLFPDDLELDNGEDDDDELAFF